VDAVAWGQGECDRGDKEEQRFLGDDGVGRTRTMETK